MKRHLILALIGIMIIGSALSSCSKNKLEDYGNVEEVEIAIEEAEEENASAFEKQENPFSEYEFKTVNFEPAKMSFEAPSSWSMDVYSHSCIRFDAPATDPIFPNATLYVKCLYAYDAMPDEFDPVSHMASEYAKPMSSYITGLPIKSKGGSAWINRYRIADDISSPDFVEDETAAVTKITKNVQIIDKTTASTHSFKGACHVATYFRWDSFPVMISIVVSSEKDYFAKDLTEYMLSTAAYLPQKADSFTVCEVGKLTFTLPSEFEPINNTGNVFMSKPYNLKSTSGMSIGIFSVPEAKEYFPEKYFNDSYVSSLPQLMLDPTCSALYSSLASVNEYTGEKLLDEALSFKGTLTLAATEEDYMAAKRTYGTSDSMRINCYIVDRGNSTYLIADIFPVQDEELALAIEKNIISSFSVN